MKRACIVSLTLGALLLTAGPSVADVPLEMPIQGVLRDNAGNLTDGTFDVTFALYDVEEDGASLWSETVPVTVSAGIFSARLGTVEALDPALFAASPGLFLGMAVDADPELPRRPLGTTGYAFQASSASDLACSGCVDPGHLSGESTDYIRSEALDAVSTAGYTTLASGLYFDDQTTALGVSNVQTALEALDVKVSNVVLDGNVQEGAGAISRYTNQWGMPSYGVATEYLHLINPVTPKVLLYLYGGENTGFASSNNLIVSNSYTPNTYSGGANGAEGDDTLTVTNAGAFNSGDHVLVYQTIGNDPGHWELNAVQAINGNSLKLAKDLVHSYVSKTGNEPERAQVVIAASYNQFEVVNGGSVYPSDYLSTGTTDNHFGGIIYIRARQITIKNGGIVHADNRGFGAGGSWNGWQTPARPGYNECQVNLGFTWQAICSGGGGGTPHGSWCDNCNYGAGGGGNKTQGETGKHSGCSWSDGQGGAAKGTDQGVLLTIGGGGGNGYHEGGRGGGLVVLGAETIIIEAGGEVRANGGDAGQGCHAAGGGGAGGTVALFADIIQVNGTVEAVGGTGGDSSGQADGGDGGEGWVHQLGPIPGIVNQSYATGVEIWIDDQEVTASVGDPNGKGSPHWDAANKKWGATGTEPWSTGPLDLSNVANWTLGEHRVQFKETGGAGGDLKAYFYLVQPFTESTPPANDTCAAAELIDPETAEVVISGTTEDAMGKILATDASSAAGCGGIGGPEVVYQIDLSERSLLHADVVAPFPPKIYLLEAACTDGELVYCADKSMTTNPIEPGTYFLFVDSDATQAKGDFKLTVSTTPAPLPDHDTCDAAMPLIFGVDGTASHSGTTLYSLDQYKGLCPSALTGGPDVVYTFDAGTGQTLNIDLTSDFEPILFVTTLACEGASAIPLSCSASGSLTIQGLAGGTYWLFVDGVQEKAWGSYDLSLTLE